MGRSYLLELTKVLKQNSSCLESSLGHYKEICFGPTENLQHLSKISVSKTNGWGGQTHFLCFLIFWISTPISNGIHWKHKFTTVTKLLHTPTKKAPCKRNLDLKPSDPTRHPWFDNFLLITISIKQAPANSYFSESTKSLNDALVYKCVTPRL